MKNLSRIVLLAGSLAISACGTQSSPPTDNADSPTRDMYKNGSLLGGEGGMTLYGPSKRNKNDENGGIGVNSYLWRASLDTLAFMPLASADPFGGVILTDWYSPPNTPDERFKVNIYILDRQLRADGIRVSVFRQQREGGGWRDVAVTDDAARRLEDTILTRARQLRITQTAAQG
jgi:hypothetical protein